MAMGSGKHTLGNSLSEEKAVVTSEGAWIAEISFRSTLKSSHQNYLHGRSMTGPEKGRWFLAGVVMTARTN